MNNKNLTKTKTVLPIMLKEMGAERYELFGDTFKRIKTIVSESGVEVSENTIKSTWSKIKQEIPVLIINNSSLTRSEREILLEKSTAFTKKKHLKNSSSVAWTYEEEQKLLFFILENRNKNFKEIYELASDKLYEGKRTPVAIKLRWGYLKNNLSKYLFDPNDIAILKNKRQDASKKVERRNLNGKITIDEVIEMANTKTNNNVNNNQKTTSKKQETKKQDSKKSETKKSETKYISDYVFKQIDENTFQVIKGVVTIDKEFVQNKLNSDLKVIVLTDENEILAKNFI